MTLMDLNPGFKVTAFLKSNISITVCLRDNTNRKSKIADRSVSVPMTLSDLERPDVRNQ